MGRDLTKQDLYESVKAIAEAEHNHLHLNQHKLYTLFSVAFQYLLFKSTKEPGAYIIRIEDSALAEKLARKAKDPTTRRFLNAILLPRKFKYQKSVFYLDFFHVGTWSLTSDIPKEKIKAALIVKNTSDRPMAELMEEEDSVMAQLPKDYYRSSLADFVPQTITIAFDQEFEDTQVVAFPFIKKDKERCAAGVTISKDIDLGELD